VLDRKWREHLYEMDYLRDGIGLRAMAQRDPLIEYQREGFDLFRAMMDSIQEETVGLLFNLEVTVDSGEAAQDELDEGLEESPDLDEGVDERAPGASTGAATGTDRPAAPRAPRAPVGAAAGVGAQAGHPMADLSAAGLGPRRPDRVQYTAPSETGEATVVGTSASEFAGVGRNAMCPCGSGKKYKRCHGDPRLRN
jgi:preprotein translocase subunit SecA